jgi:hypothetical protein
MLIFDKCRDNLSHVDLRKYIIIQDAHESKEIRKMLGYSSMNSLIEFNKYQLTKQKPQSGWYILCYSKCIRSEVIKITSYEMHEFLFKFLTERFKLI